MKKATVNNSPRSVNHKLKAESLYLQVFSDGFGLGFDLIYAFGMVVVPFGQINTKRECVCVCDCLCVCVFVCLFVCLLVLVLVLVFVLVLVLVLVFMCVFVLVFVFVFVFCVCVCALCVCVLCVCVCVLCVCVFFVCVCVCWGGGGVPGVPHWGALVGLATWSAGPWSPGPLVSWSPGPLCLCFASSY